MIGTHTVITPTLVFFLNQHWVTSTLLCTTVVLVVHWHLSIVITHHNSLLFYFIRYIIGNFLVVVLSVYMCVFLHLSASWQGFLHHVMSWLVSLLCCCSFLTHCNSLLFYFIRYIIGNFFVFVLTVYVCVFLHLSVSWWGFLHHVMLWLVSLLLLLFCSFLTCYNSLLFYFIRYIIGNFFVVVLSVYVCVFLSLSVICILEGFSASCHVATCFFVDVVDFSLVTTLFVLFH